MWEEKEPETLDSVVRKCLDGENDVSRVDSNGQKYCSALNNMFKKLCPYLGDDKVFVSTRYGNHSIDRYYPKCEVGDNNDFD